MSDRKKTMAQGMKVAKEIKAKEFDDEMERVLLEDRKLLERLAKV